MKRLERSARAGFTLVELVVVMLIITIVAGVTLPALGAQIDREARKATQAELASFDTAVRHYFMDVGLLPATVNDLLLDTGVAGWSGPYISGGVQTSGNPASDFDLDGWNVPYRLVRAGDIWTLTSAGPDRVQSTGDDIVLTVDVTRERRRLTLERLEVINLAIRLYNEDWLSPPPPTAPDPLSDLWSSAYAQLVARGYLPNSPLFRRDGWGSDFLRVGTTGPVVAVTSPNIGL